MAYGFNNDKSMADVVSTADINSQSLVYNGISVTGNSYFRAVYSNFVVVAANLALIEIGLYVQKNWAAGSRQSANLVLPSGYEIYYPDSKTNSGVMQGLHTAGNASTAADAYLIGTNYTGVKHLEIYVEPKIALTSGDTVNVQGLILLKARG